MEGKANTNYLRTRKVNFPHLFGRSGKRPSRYAPSRRDLLQSFGSNGKHHGQLLLSFFLYFVALIFRVDISDAFPAFLIPRHPDVSHARPPTLSHVARNRTCWSTQK
jgi:hypothetical protein